MAEYFLVAWLAACMVLVLAICLVAERWRVVFKLCKRLYDRLFWREKERDEGRKSDIKYAMELFPGVDFHIRHLVHAARHTPQRVDLAKEEEESGGKGSFMTWLQRYVKAQSIQMNEGGRQEKKAEKPSQPLGKAGGGETASQEQADEEKDEKEGAEEVKPETEGKYVVYIDFHYMVRVDAKGSACRYEQSKGQRQLHAKADMLNSLPTKHLTKTHRLAFKKMVGQLYVCAIENDLEIAKTLYKETVQYYESRGVETFRYRQICYSLFVYVPLIIAFHWWAKDLLETAKFPSIQVMVIASLTGSFLTIFRNAGKRELDAECTRRILLCDCVARAVIAMVMGALTWCVMKSEFILVAFTGMERYSYIVIAFAAGMVDTYIPSLICKSIPLGMNENEAEKKQKREE